MEMQVDVHKKVANWKCSFEKRDYCIVLQLFIIILTYTVLFTILQIPNPLFDLAGITCGHFLIPFWTFFGATLIGKAVIKMHIQVSVQLI